MNSMILQPDRQFNKIAHAIAFVDMYINAPELMDGNTVYRTIRDSAGLKVSEIVTILIQTVAREEMDEYSKRTIMREMRRPEFRRYIYAITQE